MCLYVYTPKPLTVLAAILDERSLLEEQVHLDRGERVEAHIANFFR